MKGSARIVITITPEGTVIAEDDAGREALAALTGRYKLVEGPPGVLIFEGEGPQLEQQTRVLISGEVLGDSTVIDVISMIGGHGWSGELTVVDGSGVRRLEFDQGALKSVFSNLPHERLGETMLSLGAITPEQLARCLALVDSERRLGEIAVDEGVLDRQRLFEMLSAQAKRIFQSALQVTAGFYTFTVHSEEREAPAMMLHLPIQNLLLDGVRRIDEMAHLRERIPSSALCPVVTESAAWLSITDSLRPLALLSDGQHSIADIGRELQVDELEATRRVMQLLQIGFVELKDRPGPDNDAVHRIVRQLNEVLREINDTADRHGGGAEMRWNLRQSLADPRFVRYFGEIDSIESGISPQATLRRLHELAEERPIESLHRAAHELVSFAMFAASPKLPREAERALSKWVNQRMMRLTVV